MVARCTFTTAAVAAANPGFVLDGPQGSFAPYAVSRIYNLAWPAAAHAACEAAFRRLLSRVDGGDREVPPRPDWSLNCVIETHENGETVWRTVSCHVSQTRAFEEPSHLSPENHEALRNWQSYDRAFSTVNGGRARDSDLFEGLRSTPAAG